jgi:hypothetical protein
MARRVNPEAQERLAADRELADTFPELLDRVAEADGALRDAEAAGRSEDDVRGLAMELDAALTDAMRAAYARQRVEIGPRGYDDWIYRRARKAKPFVKRWTTEAERLLTMREANRLTGVPNLPVYAP